MKKFNRLSPKQRNRFIAKLIIPKLKKRRLRIDGKKVNPILPCIALLSTFSLSDL